MAKFINYVPNHDSNPVCPFGLRDISLLSGGLEACYYGNHSDLPKCPYFVKYEWFGEHAGTIICKHPPVNNFIQLSLFD